RCAILGCGVEAVDAAGGMRDYVAWLNGLLTHEDIVRDLLVESPLAHPSVMMRAEVLRDLHGYRAFDGPEDYDLWLRAHAGGWRFGKRAEVLLGRRGGLPRSSGPGGGRAAGSPRAHPRGRARAGPARRGRPHRGGLTGRRAGAGWYNSALP